MEPCGLIGQIVADKAYCFFWFFWSEVKILCHHLLKYWYFPLTQLSLKKKPNNTNKG